MTKVLDTYNAAVGAAIAVLSYIFGEHWMLFALVFSFQCSRLDHGMGKSRLAHKESSSVGWKGVLQKAWLLADDRGSFWRISCVH